MIKVWTLSNGVRVAAEPLDHLRSVSVGVWMHTGSLMETEAEAGLSHLMEHMVFKGTERRTTREIAEEMDAHGGQINAYTARDCTCFYCRVIDEDLALALDMLSDLTLHATLSEEELERERGVVLEEIAMGEDDPEDLVGELLQAEQFAGQSAGRSILGGAGQVSAYTRGDLLTYRGGHYTPSRMVVSVCGSFDEGQLRQLVERYFGAWHNDAADIPLTPAVPLDGRVALREKDVEQLHLSLGWPGCAAGAPEVYPLAVINSVIGGSMSSRLFQRVREEMGMAYSIYSYASGFEGSGTFAVYAGVSPKNGERVLEEITREVRRFVREGITDKEFHEAVSQLRIGFLLSLEGSGSRMQSMGRTLTINNRVIEPEETLRRIDELTRQEVMACAERLLTVKPCLAVVGRGAEAYRGALA